MQKTVDFPHAYFATATAKLLGSRYSMGFNIGQTNEQRAYIFARLYCKVNYIDCY